MISENDLLNKVPNLYGTPEEVMKDWLYYSERENFVMPSNIVLLYADYHYGNYEGEAYVFGYNTEDGKFFEVYGGHCSCYGLEGQWDEEYFDSFKQLKATIIHRFKTNGGYYTGVNVSDEVKSFFEITDEDLNGV